MRRSEARATLAIVVLLAVISAVPLARAGFGPWWGAPTSSSSGTTQHKGLQEITFAGAYGDWCVTSATCPATATYNLTWNLNARATLSTAWERLQADQQIINPSCGSYNYGSSGNSVNGIDPNIGLDATVSAMQNAGIKVIMDIYVLAACTTGGAGGTNPPSSVAAWQSYINPLITHYAARGVHVWEVWNEANLDGNWGGGSGASAAHEALYVSMVCAVWNEARSLDSSAVVMPSLSAQFGSSVQATTYLSGLYSNGLHGCVNALAYHPYPAGGPNNNVLRPGNWDSAFFTSPSLLSIMQGKGDGSAGFYFTEIGCSEVAGQSSGLSWNYCGNSSSAHPGLNQGQAIIIDAFTQANSTSNLVAITWWQTIINPNDSCASPTAPDPLDNCDGLYDGGTGAIKPMGQTFASVSGKW